MKVYSAPCPGNKKNDYIYVDDEPLLMWIPDKDKFILLTSSDDIYTLADLKKWELVLKFTRNHYKERVAE